MSSSSQRLLFLLPGLAACDTFFASPFQPDSPPMGDAIANSDAMIDVPPDAQPGKCFHNTDETRLCIAFDEKIVDNGTALDRSPLGNAATLQDVASMERAVGEPAMTVTTASDIFIKTESGLDLQGPMTYGMWLWLAQNQPQASAVVVPFDNDAQYSITFSYTTGMVSCHITMSGMPSTTANVSYGIDRERWYHVACVKTATTLAIYIDGFFGKEVPATKPIATGDPTNVHIGQNAQDGGSTQPMAGKVDDVLVLDRALTEAELRAIVTAPP